MALTLPDPRQIESLKDRALRGKDLLFLRQWTGLSIADCCYLLGMPVVRWHYYQKHPDRLIDDAGVALLARALLTHPEAHFLPRFPEFAEVEPAFRHALRQCARALPEPDTALMCKIVQKIAVGRQGEVTLILRNGKNIEDGGMRHEPVSRSTWH